jgi:hypothetical protein
LLFSKDNRDKIKKEYPDLSPSELLSVIGQVWNTLGVNEKKPYEDQFIK